jgi:hypothetical protein
MVYFKQLASGDTLKNSNIISILNSTLTVKNTTSIIYGDSGRLATAAYFTANNYLGDSKIYAMVVKGNILLRSGSTIIAEGGASVGPWATTGNDIYNVNTGNVGIGVIPKSKLHVNGRMTLDSSGNFELMANMYFPGDKYLASGYAGRIEFNKSVGSWYFGTSTASGVIDAAVTLTTRTTINSLGLTVVGYVNIMSKFTQSYNATTLSWDLSYVG